MQALKLPAGAGFDWLSKGFAIFKKRPAFFLLLAFIWHLNTIFSIQLLGLFGLFSAALVQPVYIAFILLCCHHIHNGKRFSLNEIFDTFRQGQILKSLLIAGCIYGLIFIVLNMFFTPSLIKESEIANVIEALTASEVTEESYAAIAASINPFAIILMVLYSVLITLVYWFVPSLILWNGTEVVKSIVFSTIGVMRNLAAFVMMGLPALLIAYVIWNLILVAMSMGAVGALLAFVLQIILISLLMSLYCAMYVSYKQIFQSA
ncbi:hypothetical protein AAEX37_01285 [Oligella sp. MSHR50489EDL]|uniref:BPSS1780 family membrane protein n=1 Tax=Oligella sp. MSHR50489EDL TaxID=3139409 RepID=UPI003D8151FD